MQEKLLAKMQALAATSAGLPALNSRYLLLHKIGSGTFSKVSLAVDLAAQRLCAVKILRRNADYSAFECLSREIGLLRRFSKERFSPRLRDYDFQATLAKHTHTFKVAFIATELVFPGDLKAFTRKDCPAMAFGLLLHIYKQMVMLTERLRKYGLYQSDLKLENMLIDERTRVYLCDLSSVRQLQSTDLGDYIFTEQYCPPELLRLLRKRRAPPGFDFLKTTVFAFGVILYALIFKEFPQASPKTRGLSLGAERIADKDLRAFASAHLRQLLEPDHAKRLTFEEVRKYVFTLGGDAQKCQQAVDGGFILACANDCYGQASECVRRSRSKQRLLGLCESRANASLAAYYSDKGYENFLADSKRRSIEGEEGAQGRLPTRKSSASDSSSEMKDTAMECPGDRAQG